MSEPWDAVLRMTVQVRVFAVVLSFVLAAGCGVPAGSGGVPFAGDGPAASVPAGTPQPARSTATGAPGGVPATAGTAARAAFLSHVFTDVRDGKRFQLGDFQGKQVLVIGMAVW